MDPTEIPDIDSFKHPKYFINRELSWLEFNKRVLEEAQDRSNPLFERMKFLAIFESNLDEFFMIRVANLREAEVAGVVDTKADGLTPVEQLEGISERCHELIDEHAACLIDEVIPELDEQGIHFHRVSVLPEAQQRWAHDYFKREVFPVLTPMTVDPSHPFPFLANQSNNIIVTFDHDAGDAIPFAIVEVPGLLSPFIRIEPPLGPDIDFLELGDLIISHLGELFHGLRIQGAWLFRVTRNSDFAIEEQEVENLLRDLERELRERNLRRVVRLEVNDDMPEEVLDILRKGVDVPERELYRTRAMLGVNSLWRIYGLGRFDHLKDPPFNPRLSPRLALSGSIFSIIREDDLLLHHPYESFSTVVELLQQAAHDPKVLAIKLTLYRTSGDSVIIQALKDAATNGKQVTAVVELKARFDEKNNIVWARELERAGCHVVYGIVGLKTHTKAALIVRREKDVVHRYVHLATGNYNSSTARLYTDIGLLSRDPELGEDVSQLFNILTGYNIRNIQDVLAGNTPSPTFNKLAVAPFNMRERVLELIEQEIGHHLAGSPGLIQAKFNSLVDPEVIRALYRASCAGVTVRLNVRGICCLRPGIPGVSENITVVSIVDRFLEHSRIFHFGAGGQHRVYVSSADWMQRNLNRRIEQMFPIESPRLSRRLIDEVLGLCFADNVKSRRLNADGKYVRIRPEDGETARRAQEIFIELARQEGLKSAPYDAAIREAIKIRRKAMQQQRGIGDSSS